MVECFAYNEKVNSSNLLLPNDDKKNNTKCKYCGLRPDILNKDKTGKIISILEYDSFGRCRYSYPDDSGEIWYSYTDFEYTTGD